MMYGLAWISSMKEMATQNFRNVRRSLSSRILELLTTPAANPGGKTRPDHVEIGQEKDTRQSNAIE